MKILSYPTQFDHSSLLWQRRLKKTTAAREKENSFWAVFVCTENLQDLPLRKYQLHSIIETIFAVDFDPSNFCIHLKQTIF